MMPCRPEMFSKWSFHFIFLLAILLVLKGTKFGRSLPIYIYDPDAQNTQTNLALRLNNSHWAAHLPICTISCTGEDIVLKIQRLFQALPF